MRAEKQRERERDRGGKTAKKRGNKECVAEDRTNCRQWLFFILEGEIASVNRAHVRIIALIQPPRTSSEFLA